MFNFIFLDSLVIVFIILIICLIINYIIAKKFERIAFDKGYDESIHSCAMCFWLGVVGYLYVIALPDLNLHNNVNENLYDIDNIEDIYK